MWLAEKAVNNLYDLLRALINFAMNTTTIATVAEHSASNWDARI